MPYYAATSGGTGYNTDSDTSVTSVTGGITYTNAVWNNWNYVTGSATTISAPIVWKTWTNATYGESGASTVTVTNAGIIWSNWTGQIRYTQHWNHQQVNQQVYVPPTAEEQRRAKVQRRWKRRKQRQTAEQMLSLILSEEQMRDWRTKKIVRYRGKAGIFEINPGFGGELYLLDHDGKPKDKFCMHASFQYPVEDRVGALALALMHDEDDVLKRANRPAWNQGEKERLERGEIRWVDREYDKQVVMN